MTLESECREKSYEMIINLPRERIAYIAVQQTVCNNSMSITSQKRLMLYSVL